MAKQAPKKKGANGYKLPDPLPKGEVLIDLAKKKWILGSSIGQGGFGEIYAAQEADSKGASYPYVVKIEPHENGPLFVEINFYIRNAKFKDIDEFQKKKGFSLIGMPEYLGSGSHEHKGQKYRFLVMHRFGDDIWKLFLKNDRKFPISTVFKLGVQILDVLEYIHDRGYVHADIKGANILLGLSKQTKNQAYLVDFGLVTKYQVGGVFKPNPKKAHDGTIEYLSRDAHHGVPSRRGDLEILAYNLIQWLGCTLPWEKNLSNPVNVQKSKEEYMSDLQKLVKHCFGSEKAPGAIVDFLNYINTLEFDTQPDYPKIRKMFITALQTSGDKLDSPFVFKGEKTTMVHSKSKATRNKSPVKKSTKNEAENQNSSEEIENRKTVSPSKRKNESKATTSKKLKKVVSEEEITGHEEMKKTKPRKLKEENLNPVRALPDAFEGYTAEMKALALKKIQNGVKDASKKKNSEFNVKVDPDIDRPRRNKPIVNYKESPSKKGG